MGMELDRECRDITLEKSYVDDLINSNAQAGDLLDQASKEIKRLQYSEKLAYAEGYSDAFNDREFDREYKISDKIEYNE